MGQETQNPQWLNPGKTKLGTKGTDRRRLAFRLISHGRRAEEGLRVAHTRKLRKWPTEIKRIGGAVQVYIGNQNKENTDRSQSFTTLNG
ncbi:hypothetical protein J7T55_013808 [Diaporthe amygdali]|uniref:uncharacterized protein n=1 Tax=Phomopsis amygdali TaxID=1214568 RepID=UPI0022FE554A|nr:uncharacterized protein J7T55_013808 [Diaporthe amygdali]KAJ0119605.1 hypothetical protein J7T55_013808 [Diaporthe amygdali]